MQDKIDLEERFAIEETIAASAGFAPVRWWPELKSRRLNFYLITSGST